MAWGDYSPTQQWVSAFGGRFDNPWRNGLAQQADWGNAYGRRAMTTRPAQNTANYGPPGYGVYGPSVYGQQNWTNYFSPPTQGTNAGRYQDMSPRPAPGYGTPRPRGVTYTGPKPGPTHYPGQGINAGPGPRQQVAYNAGAAPGYKGPAPTSTWR